MKLDENLTARVRQTLETGGVPALMGESGIGKSAFANDLAYSMGTKCFTVQCNLLADKSDLTGGRLMKDDTGTWSMAFFPHEEIMAAIDYAKANPGEYPMLLLDEINRTTGDVTSATLGISTARKIGREKLPRNLRLMVAGNLRGNVTTLDEASLSRFVIFNVVPDAPTFMRIIGDRLNPYVREVLTAEPKLIFCKARPEQVVADGRDDEEDQSATMAELFDTGEEMRQFATPRTIENVSNWLNVTSAEELATALATESDIDDREISLLEETLEAFTGQTAFTASLLATIATDMASGGSSSRTTQVTVPRPPCYDRLSSAATASDLESIIASLSDNERAGCLLYAISENAGNSRTIALLAGSAELGEEHVRTLMEMITHQQFDTENLEALLETDTRIAHTVRPIASAYQ